MKIKIAVILLTLAGGLSALAQGATFTYQGRLGDGGAPANGLYDFRFFLYNGASGGAQIGVARTNSAVQVASGAFTVNLDFGAGAFDGGSRWLQVEVRTNNAASFTPLDPRQPIQPTPYAMFSTQAGSAATFTNLVADSQIPVTIARLTTPQTFLSGVSAPSFSGDGLNLNNLNASVLSSGTVPDARLSANIPLLNSSPTFTGNVTANGDLAGNRLRVGGNHTLSGTQSSIAGGYGNQINGWYSVIGGGYGNTNLSYLSGIVGGEYNIIRSNGNANFIGSGQYNTMQESVFYGVIAGGYQNTIAGGNQSFIGGGNQNLIQYASSSVISGGYSNVIGSMAGYSAIAGGTRNTIDQSSDNSFVGAGSQNIISSNVHSGTIGGGLQNSILTVGNYAVIAGGQQNAIQDWSLSATVSGGQSNIIQANSEYATIGGGFNNQVRTNGDYAIIPGGWDNVAGLLSFAAGRRAKATNQGAFVWADSQNADFGSTADNQFIVRAAGGVGINTNAPTSALHVAGTVTANAFSGSGAQLTSLSGTALSSASITSDKLAPGALNHLDAPDGSPVNALQVSSNGLVGVGTSTPQAGLHIATGTPVMVPSILSIVTNGVGSYTNMSANDRVSASGSLLAVVNPDISAFTLIDVATPANPIFRSTVRNGAGSFTNLNGASSAAISGSLLAVGAYSANAVTLADISNPAAPVWRSVLRDGVGAFTSLAGPNALALSGAFLVIASSGDHAITLVNVTTPASPVRYCTLTNGFGGFNKLSNPSAMALSGNLLVVASPDDHAVSLINVASKTSPTLYTNLVDGVDGFNGLHNVSDIALAGSVLALSSWYDQTVTLVDVSNPASPQLLATLTNPLQDYPLVFVPNKLQFLGNYLLISVGNGLLIVNVSTPSAPVVHTVIQDGFAGFYPFIGATPVVSGTTLAVNTSDRIYMVNLASTQPVGLVSEDWVAIGTTVPLAPLHVRGNVLVEAASTVSLMADHIELGRSDASGFYSLAMGNYATASGDYSTAIGTLAGATGDNSFALGRSTLASGDYSMALGRNSQAAHNGAFVWSDSQNATVTSTGSNQFLIRAAGGVGINTNNPQSALHVVGAIRADSFVGSGAGLTDVAQLGSNQTFSGTASFVPATGAPFLVGSTNKVLSLNSDLLDGLDSTNFASASHNHYGSAWTGAATKGLSLRTDATASGVAALYGQEGAGSGNSFPKPAGVWGDSTNGYGVIGSSLGAAGVLGYSSSLTGIVYGVSGQTLSTNGRGVAGLSFATTGTNYGVYGSTASTNGVGVLATAPINGGVAFKATGSGVIQSSADSYVFVPGNAMVKNMSTDTTHWDMQAGGAARIWGGTNFGSKTVYFPVTLPAVLYGQPVTVSEVAVYYRCNNSANGYITGTYMDKLTSASASVPIISDTTARTNTTAASYSITPVAYNALSADQGAVGVYLMIAFANDTDWVQIGGIRFRLSHD